MSEALDERSDRPATERAEEVVDRVAESIGGFAAQAGLRIRKIAALTREGAEDMWAEAQSIRRERGRRKD